MIICDVKPSEVIEEKSKWARCSRCGTIHDDYDILVLIINNFSASNCELYIPNVDELRMEDGTIILQDLVQ